MKTTGQAGLATHDNEEQPHLGWIREFNGRINTVVPVMGDSALITFGAPSPLVTATRAGQFVEILCRDPGSHDPLLRRPFSIIAADEEQSTLTILVRPYGRGSGWLFAQPPGVDINVLGPLGNSFGISPRSQRLLMVAGGVGAAPLLMLAREAIAQGCEVTYLLGAMNSEGLLSNEDMPSEVEYVVATDDGSRGHRGFVTDLVPEYLRWADQVFACGPEPMFRSLRDVVHQHRFGDKPTVHLSVERSMACGVGACLGCVVETKRGMKASCVDGPIFEMEDLVWA